MGNFAFHLCCKKLILLIFLKNLKLIIFTFVIVDKDFKVCSWKEDNFEF